MDNCSLADACFRVDHSLGADPRDMIVRGERMLAEAIQLDHEVAECEIRIITNEASEIFGTRGFGIDKNGCGLGGFQMADVFSVGEECNLVRSGNID